MSVAGTYPEKGMRVALDLSSVDGEVARYHGDAFTPWARHPVDLAVAVRDGTSTLHVGTPIARDDGRPPPSSIEPPPSLPSGDLAFVRQLGKQLWRLAVQTPPEQGGGSWPRRIQRWRGPK